MFKRWIRNIGNVIAAAALAVGILCGCGAGAGSKAPENTAQQAEEQQQAEVQKEEQEEEKTQSQKESAVQAFDEILSREFFAMDTVMILRAYGENAQEALDEAENEILRLDALLAAEQESSEISRINREGGGEVSADTAYLVENAKLLHDETGGAFEITIYPVKKAWGFTTGEYRLPSREELSSLLPLVGSEFVNLDKKETAAADTAEAGAAVRFSREGVEIDLGGIAKGYASSRAAKIYEEHGVKGMINLGGNVQLVGEKPEGSKWRVAIRKPEAQDGNAIPWLDSGSEQAQAVMAEEFVGILESSDEAVVTSGGYERYFEKDGKIYHHILDGRTGYPSDSDLISATAVSPDGTLADGLSTSIFVMGLDRATKYWRNHSGDFEMIAMNKNGELYVTQGLQGRFTSGLEIHWITK